jgi:hypothetical protein
MSGSVSATIVDWAELSKNKAKLKGTDGGQWFLEAADESETWMESANNWRSDSHPWTDAALDYDDLRGDLDEKTRQSFDRFFGVFFVGEDGGFTQTPVRDFEADALDRDVFYAIMSPSTVEQYAQLTFSLSFETLREAYEENCGLKFDSFLEYMQQWIGLLRYAAERKKGVVVSVLF